MCLMRSMRLIYRFIEIILSIWMSSLNVYQQFVDMELVKSKMQLPNPITAALDYCEYLIRMDFNLGDKNTYVDKKNRKNEIPKELSATLGTFNREQKIEYYCMVVGFMQNFLNNNFEPPKSSQSGMLNTTGFSRSFNIKRWKDKKLRLDLEKHLMFAEREQKIKSYDLRNYLLRRSKNKEYYCFVLEAINKIPPQKSMTVHIGFREQNRFNEWLEAIKFSVVVRQWELYLQLFQGKFRNSGLTKSMSAKMYTADDLYLKSSQPSNQGEVNNTSVDNVRGNDMMTSSVVIQPSRSFDNFDSPYQLKIKKHINEEDRRDGILDRKVESEKDDIEIREKLKEQKKLQNQIKDYESHKQIGKTYVDQLIEGDVFQEPDVFEQKIEEEDEIAKKGKKHLDLFHKLYPEYELEQLEIFANFEIKYEGTNFKIYQSTLLDKRMKMMAIFDKKQYNVQQILSMLSKPETGHIYNDNIQSSLLKTFIPSQNSALMYQVNKPYNRLYRGRDFVFIRHVFNNRNKVYMIDKSVENPNYPPFLTIVRGVLCNVFGIIEKKDVIELIADFQIQNGGLLNTLQEKNLTIKYLRGFEKITSAEIGTDLYKFFQLDWDISKNKANQIENQIRMKRKTLSNIRKEIIHVREERNPHPEPEIRNFSKKRQQEVGNVSPNKPVQEIVSSESLSEYEKRYAQKSLSPSPEPFNTNSPAKKHEMKSNKNLMSQVNEVNGQEGEKPLSYQNVSRQLNSEGLVIIDQSYIKTKYVLQPLKDSKAVFLTSTMGHPIWKNEWIHDEKEGGMIFIHKKKIDDQKGVLKFILSKIAKNLVSGQSITNISLPVDIFSAESNLQRFLYSMCYGPLVLEGLVNENALKRLIKTVIFGVSNSFLYLSMEKPFNPILGETFQCWINGCPAYAEQISHHPPIGALIFKGRGYDVTAQLESKVSLGMNSGTGTNQGIYKVKFQDNVQICFISPGGEVSGLTAGDRKFNLVGKSYYWITNTNFMMELVFDRYKKGFFSIGKQEKPSDFFEGVIWEVKPEFMNKFLAGKRREPDQKERIRSYGKITGVWNKYISYNDAQIWNFDREYPLILEYDANPLPSDSNWREDILYRRKNLITRAQTEKQRLQVFQRKDRKLRQKLNKKK